jgi:carbonic anhydrase
MRRGRLAAIALAAALVSVGTSGLALAATPWSHDPASDIGPAEWGQLDPSFEDCATGMSQSPIDISAPIQGGGPALRFAYDEAELIVENTGHVIEVPMPEDAHQTLGIGGTVYTLIQYHFHAPSEHTINGQHFDLEAHLVHENAAGQLAVVGVLMDVGDHPTRLVDTIFEHAPDVAGEETEVGVEANPEELLLGAAEGGGTGTVVVNRYYAYSGSLTTPGCSEPVRWIVAKDPVAVSADAVEQMHELVSEFPGYDGYPDNNRPVQPLNGRQVTNRGG